MNVLELGDFASQSIGYVSETEVSARTPTTPQRFLDSGSGKVAFATSPERDRMASFGKFGGVLRFRVSKRRAWVQGLGRN